MKYARTTFALDDARLVDLEVEVYEGCPARPYGDPPEPGDPAEITRARGWWWHGGRRGSELTAAQLAEVLTEERQDRIIESVLGDDDQDDCEYDD